MTFVQEYSFFEYGFGMQTVRFVVSDSYDDLFKSDFPEGDGIQTDIFMLESVKQDLNTDEGSFAIDELPFSVSHLSCKNDTDVQAMFFVLDAANIDVHRYCALFFGHEPTHDNQKFIGKIGDKISGTDKIWEGDSYEYYVDPKRDYKLTAYSYDVKILEECSISGNIYKIVDNNKVPVDNINDRWSANDLADVKSLFKHRIFYKNNSVNPYCYFSPLGNLYDVLNKYLEYSSSIINEVHGTSITFDLNESDLGVIVTPASYEYKQVVINKMPYSAWNASAGNITKKLILTNNWITNQLDTTAPFIHVRMLSPFYGIDDTIPAYKTQAGNEKQLSFHALVNVSDLLFEIAKSFACYIIINYTSGNTISLEFVSRKGLVEDAYTYIFGANDASIDTSSIISKETNQFYGAANNFALDGFDIYNQGTMSDNYDNFTKKIEDDKTKKDAKYERLLLTSSPTLVGIKDGQQLVTREPINTAYKDGLSSEFDYTNYKYWDMYGHIRSETIHTSIYLPILPAPEPEQESALSSLVAVYRPMTTVTSKINDENIAFPTLSEYVNRVLARDKQYYETEYSVTVPFWNGFSKNEDGSGASWNNIKLGSKVKIKENVKRYTSSGWLDVELTRDYVVVGIETSLQKPETKLKLHSLERFAFGYWDGDVNELPGTITTDPDFKQSNSFISYPEYTIDTGETILAGDAVVQLSNGNIAKAVNQKSQGYIIGIAVEAGESGQSIKVQLEGEVYCDAYNFTSVGGQVFVRRSIESHHFLNISESLLSAPTEGEDQIAIMGVSTSPKSFKLDINVITWAHSAGGA